MTSFAAKFRPAWLPKILLAILAPLVFLGGFEMVLRVADYGRDTRFFIPDSAEFHRTNPRFTELVFPASFGLKPVNFRISRHKSDDVKRIFLIGESAAMGVPEPGFGMAPQLEAILRDAYPNEDIEIYNLGITAINSHAILPIVRQAVEFEPDLLVFYMGNNEVVGPFGPGSAITDSSPPLAFIRSSLWLKSSRTGQLIERLLKGLGRSSSRNRNWRGMEMFAEKTVPSGDPRLTNVYSNFAANVRAMLELAENAGIPSVVSTVAVNHSESSPFVSLATPNGVDANTHFLHAKELQKIGQKEESAAEFRQALELDGLRFRADARINEIIREVAAEFSNAHLAESAESLFPGGRDLFFEHVHLTFEGNNAVAQNLARIAGPLLFSGTNFLNFPTAAKVAASIGFTDFGRLSQWQAMDVLANRPPFTSQSTYAEDRGYYLEVIQDIRQRLSPTALAEVAREIDSARSSNPRSSFLAFHAAKLAVQLSDYQRAIRLLNEHDRLAPAVAESRVLRAFALAQLGKRNEAVALFRSVIAAEPFYTQSYQMLASLWMAMGDAEEGCEAFGKWVEEMPNNRGMRIAYAQLLDATGRHGEMVVQWEAVLEIVPDDERVLLPLIQDLIGQDRFDEAVDRMLAAHAYNPRNFANNDLLVQVYQQRGDAESTLRFMRDLIDSGPVSEQLILEYETLSSKRLNTSK